MKRLDSNALYELELLGFGPITDAVEELFASLSKEGKPIEDCWYGCLGEAETLVLRFSLRFHDIKIQYGDNNGTKYMSCSERIKIEGRKEEDYSDHNWIMICDYRGHTQENISRMMKLIKKDEIKAIEHYEEQNGTDVESIWDRDIDNLYQLGI